MYRETLDTPYGRCVLIGLAEDEVEAALAALPGAERDHAATLSPIRRREWIAGRTALHQALGDLDVPVLSTARGAPALPAGKVGSVSHKGAVAAALVGDEYLLPATSGWIGIDIERAAPPKLDLARRILTEREQAVIPAEQGPDRGRAVTLRFSIKEAIYKAVDPIVNRYVGFQEVEVELQATERPPTLYGAWHSTCRVTSGLPADIEAHWQEQEIDGAPFWLSFARARWNLRGWERNS